MNRLVVIFSDEILACLLDLCISIKFRIKYFTSFKILFYMVNYNNFSGVLEFQLQNLKTIER